MSEKTRRLVELSIPYAGVLLGVAFITLDTVTRDIVFGVLALGDAVFLIVYSYFLTGSARRRPGWKIGGRGPLPSPVPTLDEEAYRTRWRRTAAELRDPDQPPAVSYRELWLAWLLFAAAIIFGGFAVAVNVNFGIAVILCIIGAYADLYVHFHPNWIRAIR